MFLKKNLLGNTIKATLLSLIMITGSINKPIILPVNAQETPTETDSEEAKTAETSSGVTTENSNSQITTNGSKNSVLDPKQIFSLLCFILLFATIAILYVFSPIIRSEQGQYEEKANFINIVLPKMVEGLTVTIIVVVITLLSLSNTIDAEGTVSILSALVGYVLGKQQTSDDNNNNYRNILPRDDGSPGDDSTPKTPAIPPEDNSNRS